MPDAGRRSWEGKCCQAMSLIGSIGRRGDAGDGLYREPCIAGYSRMIDSIVN